jgi:enoyl-CoA hydratase
MTEAVAARDDSAVHAERRGAAGFIILDRPRALNALTLPMVRAIAAALDEFERDARVVRVVVASAGGRAFCSGADIRLFYEAGRAGDHAAQLEFWREDYQLNRRIARYSKPCVALVDGMRGGPQRPRFASRRQRALPVRHARGRHWLFS